MLIEPSKGVFANMLPALLPDTESEIYASVKKNYELLKIVDSPVHVYGSVPRPSHKLCFFSKSKLICLNFQCPVV